MKLKLGDSIYLNLQLWDGISSMPRRVFVELRDSTGVLIEPLFEISHVGGGEFRDSSRLMPSDDMITASYFVYYADGVTIDINYAAGKDVFMRDFSGEIIDRNLDGRISSIGGSVVLEGSILSDTIEGYLPELEVMSADINIEETLEAIIQEEVII